ncbi:IclR family transcriptional regulator [Candidimonas humi]|jgi:DNA-binding IclR family transcriptional regulator|uniref:IclR family transcriptional regulator n=1 Tax=Candidimonas humi TaxID=683355 RepID=A0ABV8P3N7_9BURK|nr:IclR family transcriptional regulator [Candidimonas humi]MBV6306104.1 IclR family transcriptional regulator [Candidimonas humi]
MTASGEVAGTQVVRRIGLLLRAIATRNRDGVRLVDLVKAVELDQSTAHRLLKALAVEGIVRQDAESKRYHLGALIYECGLAIKPEFDIRLAAKNALRRIAAFTEDTVYLVARNQHESVCLDRIEGNYPVKVLTLDTGGRRPLGTNASGLAILGSLRQDEIDLIIAHNESAYSKYGDMNAQRVRRELEAFWQRGYVSITIAAGTATVGLPILAPGGDPLAAIAVAAIESRMSPERQEQIAKFVRKEIAGIGVPA